MTGNLMHIGGTCQVGDGTHSKILRQHDGIPYLTSRNFKDGRLDLSKVYYISEKDYSKHFLGGGKALAKPEEDDLLFSIIGTIGEPYLVRSSDRFGISSSVAIVRPDKSLIAPRFLLYWFKGPVFQNALFGIKGGVAQGYVSLEMIRSLPVPNLPLTTQNRIAGILSTYDDLIENNQRRIKILEEMARSLYREWFVLYRFPGHDKVKMVPSPLGPIPEGWEVAEFRNIFQIKYGKTLPKTEIHEQGPYPVYGAGDVIGYYDTLLCPHKVALVTSRGNGSGTVWRTREAAFVTNNSLIIQPQDRFDYWDYSFVELLLSHSNVTEAKTGSAQPQVTIENLNYVKTTVPPKDLAERFCKVTTPLYEQVDLFFQKCGTLRRTRDLLLPRLLSGQVIHQEIEL